MSAAGFSALAAASERWGACERTVAAVQLARRLPPPQLRLLQRAVDALVAAAAAASAHERAANEPQFVAAALAPPTDPDDDGVEKLHKLLTMVPLMRTDNEPAKDLYMNMVPVLVQRCVDGPRLSPTTPDLCRQLLLYLLVHPALTQNDQRTLTQWLRYLENHMSGHLNPESVWHHRIEPGLGADNIWSTGAFRRTVGRNVEFRGAADAHDPQESFSRNGRDVDEELEPEAESFQPKRRSNSLTPPGAMSTDDSCELFQSKPRSFSLSSERGAPPTVWAARSDTRLHAPRRPAPTAAWLKSLRLHKYVWLFSDISYDQMMAMDDEYLEKLGVTKGARHKILVSIKKLQERPALVASAEAALRAGGPPAARALTTLRHVLLTPMCPTDSLPAAIVRALHIASETITPLTSSIQEGGEIIDPMSLHCWLVERALHHEAFCSVELQRALRALRHRLPPRQFFRHVCDLPPAHHHKPRWRTGPPNGYKWTPKRPWHGNPQNTSFNTKDTNGINGTNGTSGTNDTNGCIIPPQRPKSHSYPPDDCWSLDALCLQMTEHAID